MSEISTPSAGHRKRGSLCPSRYSGRPSCMFPTVSAWSAFAELRGKTRWFQIPGSRIVTPRNSTVVSDPLPARRGRREDTQQAPEREHRGEAIPQTASAREANGGPRDIYGPRDAPTSPWAARVGYSRRLMVVHLIDGTYELFRHFYGRRRGGKRDDQPLRCRGRRAAHGAGDDRDGRDARRRRDRPRHRVVPQRPLAGLQDRRRRRARAARAVRAAGGGARGHGRRRLADGRARGRRRARRGRAHRRRGRRRRAGLHLDARQGPRAVRARRPGGAGRPPRQRRPQRRAACARSSASSPA